MSLSLKEIANSSGWVATPVAKRRRTSPQKNQTNHDVNGNTPNDTDPQQSTRRNLHLSTTTPPKDDAPGDDGSVGEFNVERIVRERVSGQTGSPEYLVKWEGFPSSENTWEPASNLESCSVFQKYIDEVSDRPWDPRLSSVSSTSDTEDVEISSGAQHNANVNEHELDKRHHHRDHPTRPSPSTKSKQKDHRPAVPASPIQPRNPQNLRGNSLFNMLKSGKFQSPNAPRSNITTSPKSSPLPDSPRLPKRPPTLHGLITLTVPDVPDGNPAGDTTPPKRFVLASPSSPSTSSTSSQVKIVVKNHAKRRLLDMNGNSNRDNERSSSLAAFYIPATLQRGNHAKPFHVVGEGDIDDSVKRGFLTPMQPSSSSPPSSLSCSPSSSSTSTSSPPELVSTLSQQIPPKPPQHSPTPNSSSTPVLLPTTDVTTPSVRHHIPSPVEEEHLVPSSSTSSPPYSPTSSSSKKLNSSPKLQCNDDVDVNNANADTAATTAAVDAGDADDVDDSSWLAL